MNPSKLIISKDKEYSNEYILEELYNRKIELFCSSGKFSEQWELAMDYYITTTSHGDEPLENVINFAKLWSTKSGNYLVETIKL